MRYFKSFIGLTICCALTITWAAAAPPAAKPAPRKSKTPPPAKSTGSGKKAVSGKGANKGAETGGNSNPAKATQKYALLVGCTKYPNMPIPQLEGPAHDVELMRVLLQEKFRFKPEQIVTLAEAQPANRRPTRAHIEREFRALDNKVRKGDDVVILLAGHGTQQPDSDPPDEDDPEPDCLDEVFLPSDARFPEGDSTVFPNGLVDDDLGAWVKRIRDHGASVWIIIDSCHSGTIVRKPSDEKSRYVDPGDIYSAETMAEVSRRVKALIPRTLAADTSLTGKLSHIVAIYAAEPHQLTVELPLPKDSDQQTPYGLLTYSISKVLRESTSRMSYRDLVKRVQTSYFQSGRVSPTPLIEGDDADLPVLNWMPAIDVEFQKKAIVKSRIDSRSFEPTNPIRTGIWLSKNRSTLQINVGAINGMTVGSIFAVFPPPGVRAATTPLGHVRIESLSALTADVAPCEYNQTPVNLTLPEDGRCELAYLDAGLHRLRIFVDVPESLRQAVAVDLEQVTKRLPLVAHAAKQTAADWVLHGEADKKSVTLEPASGIDPNDLLSTPRFGPVEVDVKFADWLEDHLRRMARAQNLIRLMRPSIGQNNPATEIKMALETVRYRDDDDEQGEPIIWQQDGVVLHVGDRVGCRIKNNGQSTVDVTLLYIDAGYGITTFFPAGGLATENRIFPGETKVAIRTARISNKTIGIEHLVLIAVPGEGPPIDFSALEQPTLELYKKEQRVGRDGRNNPLEKLLRDSLYTVGGTRGQDAAQINQQQFELSSWRVKPKLEDAEKAKVEAEGPDKPKDEDAQANHVRSSSTTD